VEELRRENGRPQVYRLQVGDALSVKVFRNPDLNEDIIIRPDGKISLQMIGSLMAADLSPEELSVEIEAQYQKILRNPVVTVQVRQLAAQRAFLGGEVRQPGLLRMESSTTVLQAIFQAGGCLDTASLTEVVLIRRGENAASKIYKINLEDPLNDVYILPSDIVFVPKSAIASADLFVEQYIDKLIPISRAVSFSYVKDYYSVPQ